MAESEIQYPRRIMVDDKDPRIVYDATSLWNLDVSAFNNTKTFGDPYKQTLTGTNSNRASFTFTFEGDFVQVRGAKHSQDPPPIFTCKVDNNSIDSNGYNSDIYVTTNLVLCEKGLLSKGRHTLTMDITISDPAKQVFWLDSIEYSPLDNADLTKQTLKVDWSETQSCSYDNKTGQWKAMRGDFDLGVQTRELNATMSLKFNGRSNVSVYGANAYGANRTRLDSTTGTWQIDNNHPAQEFTIPGSKGSPEDQTTVVGRANQHLFTTGLVDGEGEHEMVIRYSGSRDTESPQFLYINYFYVENDSKPVEPEERTVPVGAIAGGVLGGVFGLIAIGGLVWFMRRRRRRKTDHREVHDGRWSGLSSNAIPEVWSGEPLQEPWSPTARGTVEYTPIEPLTPVDYEQREVIHGHGYGESDRGARYAALHTSNGSQETATTPPAYTPA
ncbi:hypothetical protein AAF712_012176 [Marasmius tenuissimus]|uniref:Uncharacterized protein n=1 Tax=Marasmius tenuissimus TaxID=585030 RepID=A0ABR2ZI67_9AGAR